MFHPQANQTRRSFLARSAAAASTLAFPFVSTRSVLGANDRLNIAGIGCGGKGKADLTFCQSQNIVALVDVDHKHGGEMMETFSEARRFKDYRVMFDQMSDRIDAVTISTPDHMHFHPAMRAIQAGKHVFCQKPLTHTVWEARTLTKAARQAGVATQMGNQGISSPRMRHDAAIVRAGVLGDILEMHCWSDRPGGDGSKGSNDRAGALKCPSTLTGTCGLAVPLGAPTTPPITPLPGVVFGILGLGPSVTWAVTS